MNPKYFRNLTYLTCIACATLSTDLHAAWLEMDDSIHVVESSAPNPSAPSVKYAATIHVSGYTDGRAGFAPKKVGITTQRVSGISGKELVLDRNATEVVVNSISKRFDDAGFQLIKDSGALYELSGVIKELSYDVKARDEISISIESTLKEISSGKVIWSGIVVQKSEHFAGISGDNKNDIAYHLKRELGVVTQKTVDAISASLMASRPDLFTLTPGTKAIAGVTVLQATGAAPAASAPSTGNAAGNGTLALTTKPARAKVYLDGIYFGMSPLRAGVEVGIHEVSVKAEHYKTASEKVSIRKGETTELELALEH